METKILNKHSKIHYQMSHRMLPHISPACHRKSLCNIPQDCLWAPKCIRQGWFLTYGTSDKEYGAWKKHYVACACNLDILSPWEAADIYGTLNETLPKAEEEKEKQMDCLIRQTICEKIKEHKSELKAFS